jgi:hypothetical protein
MVNTKVDTKPTYVRPVYSTKNFLFPVTCFGRRFGAMDDAIANVPYFITF